MPFYLYLNALLELSAINTTISACVKTEQPNTLFKAQCLALCDIFELYIFSNLGDS